MRCNFRPIFIYADEKIFFRFDKILSFFAFLHIIIDSENSASGSSVFKINNRGNLQMKKGRRFIILFTALALLCIPFSLAGDSFATAADMTWTTFTYGGNTYKDYLAYSLSSMTAFGEYQFFKVTLDQAGPYTVYLSGNQSGGLDAYTALPCDMDMGVFSGPSSSYSVGTSYANSTTPEYVSFEVGSANLGTYYISVHCSATPPSNAAFKLVLVRGDVDMFTEGARYRDYNLRNWYCRTSASDTSGFSVTSGVPYSYGNKHSLSFIITENEKAYTNASLPFNAWSKYKSYDSTLKCRRPGLFQAEYNSNIGLTSQFYGIDCSGFIQRCAQASVRNGVTKYKIARESPVSDSGSGAFGSFGNGIYDTSVTTSQLKTGDILTTTGHVVMVSRANISNAKYSAVMAAEAASQINGGRKTMEYYVINLYPSSSSSFASYALRTQ